ncbi:DUF2634 domain-containing protein [Chryseomicrobium palamuruense]|uniref:DUF2634 domain-containing protein n=1 Tax=Chryseomicrobium palamuruense TaxID=682973 RepID=A0ABV8UY02_9BACL
MIPQNGFLPEDFEIEEQPSLTYRMQIAQSFIIGTVDELEAVAQAIYKILNTERYQYVIYSWDYGIETLDLYGEPVTYVCPELVRRIKEALTQDSRILDVSAFSFDTSQKSKIHTTFLVNTIYGDVEAERVVTI